MDLTEEQLDKIVETGDFDQLVGASETNFLECKGQPYLIGQEAAKRELAKDASAFANAQGGLILIGVRTKTSTTHFGDEIEDIRPMPQGTVNTTQYQDVLDSWVYPVMEGTSVQWVPTKSDQTKGVVVVTIPRQKELSKPYLIIKTSDGSKYTELMFGYAERKGGSNKPMSIAEMQTALRSGLNYENQLNDRLSGLEALLRNQTPAGPTAEERKTSQAFLDQRIAECVAVGDIAKHRYLVITVTPEPAGTLKSVFVNSENSIKRRLEHPPSLRWAGWDLTHDGHVKIVKGSFLRATSGGDRKVIDLYRDGTMVSAVYADSSFLAWGRNDTQRINPLALIEFVYAFLNFYSFALQDLDTAPISVLLRIELHNMHLNNVKSHFAPFALNSISQQFRMDDQPAPANDFIAEIKVPAAGYDAKATTYQLVREVYLWFGIEEQKIPYFKEDNGQKILDVEAIPKN